MIARFLSGLGRVFAAAAIAAAASTAFAAAGKPLPPDSVYQLALPLTDQALVLEHGLPPEITTHPAAWAGCPSTANQAPHRSECQPPGPPARCG